jgi:hypothetical protein
MLDAHRLIHMGLIAPQDPRHQAFTPAIADGACRGTLPVFPLSVAQAGRERMSLLY